MKESSYRTTYSTPSALCAPPPPPARARIDLRGERFQWDAAPPAAAGAGQIGSVHSPAEQVGSELRAEFAHEREVAQAAPTPLSITGIVASAPPPPPMSGTKLAISKQNRQIGCVHRANVNVLRVVTVSSLTTHSILRPLSLAASCFSPPRAASSAAYVLWSLSSS